MPAPAPLFLEVVGVEGIAGDDEDKGECKESSRGGGSWVDAYKRTKNVLGHEERVQVVFITPAFFGAYEACSTSAASSPACSQLQHTTSFMTFCC